MKIFVCTALIFFQILGLSKSQAFDLQRCSNSYITNDHQIKYSQEFSDHLSKMRFGNQFMSYFKAQWLSHITGLPYLHSPFENDELLRLRDIHRLLEQRVNSGKFVYAFRKIHELDPERIFVRKKCNNVFVVLMQATDSRQIASGYDLHNWLEMRSDRAFINKMRRRVRLKQPSEKIVFPPKDRKSIAVHIRKGGGYDGPLWSKQYFDDCDLAIEAETHYDYGGLQKIYQDVLKPMKSPPEQYYVDQINEILSLYPNDLFYIHIFTDDANPQQLVERMQEKIQEQQRVQFGFRSAGNRHDANVLEDFISMMNFTMFIRTCSSFSVFPHVLGNFELVVFPHKYQWVGQCLTYPEVVYEWSLNHREIKKRKRQ